MVQQGFFLLGMIAWQTLNIDQNLTLKNVAAIGLNKNAVMIFITALIGIVDGAYAIVLQTCFRQHSFDFCCWLPLQYKYQAADC